MKIKIYIIFIMNNNFNEKVVKIIVDNTIINPINPSLIESNPRTFGTGFFIDNKGTILTCSHVIENSETITIEIPELNKIFEAEILGFMPELDIGLLKINYKSNKFFELGNSNKLKLGMDIYALGYPGTYSSEINLKINKGIISGTLGTNLIIDSPINSGNSGGPLIYKNKVIGINIASLNNKQNMNISVPIHLFINYEKELKNNKNIITYKNFLPILYNNSNDTYYNKSFKNNGVYIYNNLNNLNIPNNSILYKIDNYNINSFGKLNYKWFNDNITIENYILNKKPNSNIILEFYNIDKKTKKKINYKLKEYVFPIREKFLMFENIFYFNIGGGIFQELNSNIIDYNDLFFMKFFNYKIDILKKNESIVIISFIYSNSYLGKLNVFNDGTIIYKLNDKKIKSYIHFKTMVQQNKNKKIKLEDNEGKIVFITV